MRITGGRLGGRRVTVPRGSVRPTQDRVREALFSILGSRIEEARFLDLFAGSGIVGLEALSRGAGDVVWVESDRRVFRVLRQNVTALCGTAEGLVLSDAQRFLRRTRPGPPFDIIFADPPYARAEKGGSETIAALLAATERGRMLAPGGVLIFEQRSARSRQKTDPRDETLPEGWRLADDRKYGESRLRFLNHVTRTTDEGR